MKGKTMEGRRKKKGKKTKQMNANSQEPEGLVSKYWSQFRAHYVQGNSKRIFACFWPGKGLQKQRWSRPAYPSSSCFWGGTLLGTPFSGGGSPSATWAGASVKGARRV